MVVIATSLITHAMAMKKIAVGKVHTIHCNMAASLNATQGKALGQVIAHEVYDQCTGYDSKYSRCS